MHVNALLKILESAAPKALAEEWDNAGLLIEPEEKDIKRVLVALDCTAEVAKEAAAKNAQLVLTHHPLFFKPVRSLFYSDPETAAAYTLVRNGIGLYAAHTNLDNARGGVNDALADVLGLTDVHGGDDQGDETIRAMRIGTLEKEIKLNEFALFVEQKLHTRTRIAGNKHKRLRQVAVVGGSGGDFLEKAKLRGADVLVTGEIKHSQALAASVYDIAVVEAGHYETEQIVLEPWINGLQREHKEIQYNLEFIFAVSNHSPLIAPME